MMREDQQRLEAQVDVTATGINVTTMAGTVSAGRFNFAIEAGARLYLPITWHNQQTGAMQLAAYTASLKAWKAWGDTAAVLDLANGSGITLANGAVNIEVEQTAAQTQALDFLRAVYVLELTSAGGQATRLLHGTITLRKRPA